MSITLGQDHIVQLGLKQEESICCGMRFNRFPVFFESAFLMNEGDPASSEHGVQIISTIPEISSTDHSRNQTTDKRIITKNRQQSKLLWNNNT